jgi:hypothetical protein
MSLIKIQFLLLLLLLNSATISAKDQRVTHIEAPQRVLFVGNSFTFYNNGLHTHLRKFLQAADTAGSGKFTQKSTTISGAPLADHQTGLPSLLKSFKPDAVILQGHSLEPIDPDQSAAFRSSAKQLARIVRKNHATPVLFMTWAYTGKPEMTDELAKAYGSIGDELGIMVLPVGLAFQLAEQEIPGIQLRIDDLKHPTLAGSYLAAAVVFAALYSQSPEEIQYNAGLDPELARQLRAIAWQTTQDYFNE